MSTSSADSSPFGHSTTTSILAHAQQTRRPRVSQAEWLVLSRAERIQRYSTDDTILSAHPALSSVRDTATEQLYASIDTVLAPSLELAALYDLGSAQQDTSLASGSSTAPPTNPPMDSAQQGAAQCGPTACTASQKHAQSEDSIIDTELCALQASSSVRGSAHSTSPDQEPDYATRAANVRRALDKHIWQERLSKRESLVQSRKSSHDSKQLRKQISHAIAEQRKSVGSWVSLGKTVTRSLSQILPVTHERIGAGKENVQQRSPQKTRVGSLQRKPVPARRRSIADAREVVESMLGAGHEEKAQEQQDLVGKERPHQQYRKALGLLSSSEQHTQEMLSRTKEKAANIRAKVKKTIGVWRSDTA